MRNLVIIAVILASLWGGYWFIGSTGAERAVTSWIEDREAEGWIAQAEDISTVGFPSRFDTVFTGLELADPDTGLAWTAPEFQLLSLSYKPNHVIAVLPGTHKLSTPQQNISFSGDSLRASLVLDALPTLPLDRATVEIGALNVESSAGWTAALESGQLSTRKSSAAPNRHDVHFTATNLTPASSFVQKIGQGTLLPPVFEGVTARASIDFTGPWDMNAIESARPQITKISLSEFDAKWGDLGLRLAGELDVDEQGVPTGEVQIRAENWRKMLEVAQATGAISPDFAPMIIGAVQFAAGLSGSNEAVDITLKMSGGAVYLGPFPIGASPVIRIR